MARAGNPPNDIAKAMGISADCVRRLAKKYQIILPKGNRAHAGNTRMALGSRDEERLLEKQLEKEK